MITNKKITDFPAAASLATTDLLPVVVTPATTPTDKKAPISVFLTLLDTRYLVLSGSLASVTNHSHTVLSDIGTNTHANIDSHISNTNNPHSVTKTQVGLSNVPNLSFSGSNTGDQVVPDNSDAVANNFLTAYNSVTGAWTRARPTWANIDKATSSIADITTKSHTALSDIGTNTHAQIDTFIGTTVPNTYATKAGTLAQFGATTSAQLAGVISNETGSGVLVFGTSPTFTTSIIVPQIYGQTVANGVIHIEGTSSVTTATSAVILQLNGGVVGIGIDAPAATLHIEQDPALSYGLIIDRSLDTAVGPNMAFFHTSLSPAASDYVGIINFRGFSDAFNEVTYASIYGSTAVVTDGAEGGMFVIKTMVGGVSTEGFRVDNQGYVGIGGVNPAVTCQVLGGLSVGGDDGGIASYISFTNVSSGVSTGNGTVLMGGATNRNSTGWMKIFVGTAARYVPYWTTITG